MEQWIASQIKQLTRATCIESAYPILANFSRNIGFRFCAVSITSTQRSPPIKPFNINNYPAHFKQLDLENNFNETNPIESHCNHSMLPIIWCQEMFLKAPQLWQALEDHGLQHGWSQSFHHEESGLCSVISLVRPNCPISPLELYEHFGYMFYIASHLSDLFARTLPARPPGLQQPRLSQRELEVLKLCASGKTAWEAGRVLNIAERTVSYHISKIMAKLNVCNKISAVRVATQAGLI
ncbi:MULTISPECIES: LuxR C-terminal-related transcriptional regulator [unclassified Pseudomonas]|uniref:helix-turn-helix transcriptional regulator n=1 Tax=unclassified Pseudomonas TaxID=196821 RepID=UPI000A1FD07D|nr:MULTISPECIES: LuxR C-terminal-related transcriptional regulator [unclassified Pseudomonas]